MNEVSCQKPERPIRHTALYFFSLLLVIGLMALLPVLGQTLDVVWMTQIDNAQDVALVSAIVTAAALTGVVFVLISRLESLQTARGIDSHAALHDALTGAANRRQFEITLNELLTDSQPSHTLLMIDLDRFKPVNDLYGHAAGDALLREITLGIKRLVHQGDLVARLGGDEFALLIRDQPPENAEQIALDVLQFVAKYRLAWEGQRLHVGASIGLVRIERSGLTAAMVLAASDEALYVAKDAGRGAIFVADITMGPDQTTEFRRINSETDVVQPSANSHVPENGRKQELRARVMVKPVLPTDCDRRRSNGARRRHETRHWLSVEPTATGDQFDPGILMRELVTDAAARSDGGADFARWVMAMTLDSASRMNPVSLGQIDFVLPVPARAFVVVPTLADELMRSNALARLPIRHITFVLHGVSAVYDSPALEQMYQRFVASDVRVGYEIRSDNLEGLAPLRHIPFHELHLAHEIVRKLRSDAVPNPVLDALMAVVGKTGTSLVTACVDTPEEAKLIAGMGISRYSGSATSETQPLHDVLSGLNEQGRVSY